ncbi:MAG: protein-glutamate O-methyltransferase CheR [Planctomycetes bacterium]|nr:protein-glutamate O-methyltransferase CheR [Planctomycetota bacterium]
MPLRPDDFQYVTKLVRDASAIVLEAGKEYLVELRLQPVAQQSGLASIEKLVERLKSEPVGSLHKRVIDAMTTNETSFFRDIHPFETLRKDVIPELMKKRAGTRTLNFWCAAASSGQEPFSTMMMLREHFPELATWKLQFIATDLSQDMLARCREGKYGQFEIGRGLPAQFLVKYFDRRGTEWQIKEEIRRAIDFRELNLVKPWGPMPTFDIVFIRNVLIYFDVPTKRDILQRIHRLLAPDGYLFLGGAETTVNICEDFESQVLGRTTCYRPKRPVKV